MALAVARRVGPGAVGRGGDGRLPVRPVRGAGGLSLGRAPAGPSAPCWRSRPRPPKLVDADGSVRVVPAATLQVGDRVRVRAGERVPVDGTVVGGAIERRPEGDHGRVASRCSREAGRRGLRRHGQRRGGARRRGVRPARRRPDLAAIARVREAQAGEAPVERRIARFAAWYTPAVVAGRRPASCSRPAAGAPGVAGIAPGWAAWFSRGPGRAGDRLPVRPGDRHAGGGGQRPGRRRRGGVP